MASEKYCFGINTKMQVVVIVCKNAITQRSMEQEVEEGYMIKLQFQFFFTSNFNSPCWLTRLLVFPLCLGILSVLSLSSECTSLASELPKVSYVKAIDIWLIACLLFGFASLVEYAVVQVMLNSPKRIEAEKAKIASKEKAAGKIPAAKNNTVNGTGGTPLHVSTLHVSGSGLVHGLQELLYILIQLN